MMHHTETSVRMIALRWHWAAYGILSGFGLLFLAWVLVEEAGQRFGEQWLTVSGLVLSYELVSVWRVLPLNRRADESEVLPVFGPGNSLTLLRGTLIAMLAGFLLLPRPAGWLAWLPAILYILSDFTDFFDGFLARRTNQVTGLGERLDMNHDTLGVLVVTMLAFQYGTVPWWYAVFGFARPVFLFGIWLRQQRGQPVYDLPPNPSRRGFAALQMGFVTAMLFPVLEPPGTTVAATLFMLPFTIGFLYDWFHVSGWLGQVDAVAAQRWRRIWEWVRDYLPLGLRLAVVAIYIFWTQTGLWLPAPWGWLQAIAGFAIGVGFAARFFGIAVLLLLGVQFATLGVNTPGWILLAAGTGLIFLGPGRWAVWGPEEWLVHNRAGDRTGT